MTVRPGQIIGEYRLVSYIGAGGMGDVYRAEHVRLGRAAVVKVLKHLDAGGLAWQRFFNEARIQAELNHPNIAVLYAYYDSGVMPCIIMEYVDGLTLDQILQQNGRLAPEMALASFAKIVATVQYIHERGIIHRDIKPNNIKINSRGEIKLLDFGISKASFSQNLTADGSCIGTDHYLAPEQLQGHPASVASDIWALGALFYEMVTGKRAFEAESWGELYKAISSATYTAPTAFAPSLPPGLERVIGTCLRKSPSQRYPSAQALGQALHTCSIHPEARPFLAPLRNVLMSFLANTRWRLIISVAVGVLLLATIGSYFFIFSDDVTPMPPVTATQPKPLRPPRPQTAATQPPAPATAPTSAALPLPTRRTATEPAPASGTPPARQTAPVVMRTVHITVSGDLHPTMVMHVDGHFEGSYPMPHGAFQRAYPVGSRLSFILNLPGYQGCRDSFKVIDSSDANWSTGYRLCKIGEPCPKSGCKNRSE